MIIGYARVSMLEQNLELQIDDLNEYGCEIIYQEKVSTRKEKRPERDKVMKILRKGDTLVIWKIDRYARSVKELNELIEILKEKEVDFVSLKDPIDTTTATGRLMYNLLSAFAEFERDMIKERTLAGLAAAKARGRVGGRPKGLSKESKAKAKTAASLYRAGDLTIKEILQFLHVSKQTFYNFLRHEGIEPGAQFSTRKPINSQKQGKN